MMQDINLTIVIKILNPEAVIETRFPGNFAMRKSCF